MPEIFQTTFYNNTILEWLTAMGIVLAVFILGKIVYRIFSKVVRLITAKTKSKLDDIIVDMIEEPIVASLVIFGIWFALKGLNMSDAAVDRIGHIMQFSIIMMIGWLISRLLDALIEEYIVPLTANTESDMDDQLLPILRKGTRIIIWSMAIIIGLNNVGYDVTALIAGLGIGGLAFAMAAKDTVANIFGGFTIFTDKPFVINDRVQIGNYDGSVVEIGVRSTRLKTSAGRIVTIPNSKFSDSAVENVSMEPSRKVILQLGLTYDTKPENMDKALAILGEIAATNSDLSGNPTIYFSGFGDFSMNITFIYYIAKESSIAGAQNSINLAILKQFNEAGLEFAFPSQTNYNIDAGKV